MEPPEKFPPGYKFVPTEQELIHYLQRKANGEKTRDEDRVPLKFVNLYEVEDPRSLFEDTEEDTVFVFTKLKKVSQDGSRIDRKVGDFYTWKGSDKPKPVKEGKTTVGWVKNFSYEKNKVKLGYNMREFTLDQSFLENAKFKDIAVCIIKKKSKEEGKSKNDSFQEAIEDPDQLPIADEFLPAQAISNNDFINIASSSGSVPNTQMQQCNCQEMNDQDISFVPEGCNYHQDMLFENPAVCQNQNQYQVNDKLIADVSLPDQVYRYQYQENKALVDSIPSLPSYDGYPYQQGMGTNSTIDFIQPEPYLNGYLDLDMMMELALVPAPASASDSDSASASASASASSYLSNDMIYSTFTSQLVGPLPIGQPKQSRNQWKTINTATEEPMVPMTSTLAFQGFETKSAEDAELLISKENQVEVENSAAGVVSCTTIHPSISCEAEEQNDACPQNKNVDGKEHCKPFQRNLGALLTTDPMEKALDTSIKDSILISNPVGLEYFREYMLIDY